MITGPALDLGQIDHDALRRLLDILGDDPDELADLMSDYLLDAPELVRRMMKAAESGDHDTYRIAAHTLKSNARDFGALHLSELCAAAEAAVASRMTPVELAALAHQISDAERGARERLSEIDPAALQDPGQEQ